MKTQKTNPANVTLKNVFRLYPETTQVNVIQIGLHIMKESELLTAEMIAAANDHGINEIRLELIQLSGYKIKTDYYIKELISA